MCWQTGRSTWPPFLPILGRSAQPDYRTKVRSQANTVTAIPQPPRIISSEAKKLRCPLTTNSSTPEAVSRHEIKNMTVTAHHSFSFLATGLAAMRGSFNPYQLRGEGVLSRLWFGVSDA